MKVLHINESDGGGAGRAVHRLFRAQRAVGLDSHFWVVNSRSPDPAVRSFAPTGKLEAWCEHLKYSVSRRLTGRLKTANHVIHTPALFNTDWRARINSSDADVVNLHWISNRMLSIRDIAGIQKPIIWTLHDMWAFCGAEHLAWDDRWRDGYRRHNRPAHESGFDLNRWTWQRKRKHWQQPMRIVTPSQWLADCARDSVLMREWPVSVVANPIDTERWKPLEQSLARELLGLPTHVPLLLFGSHGANHAHHKGFDLLLQALAHLRDDPRAQGMELVVFGQRAPQSPPNLGFPIHYTGHLHDDLSLRALYSAADGIVVPSRQEAFGQTASEAHACATPAIAFYTGGLPDIVEHQRTGYLAKAFDTEDLAEGIGFVLDQRKTGLLGDQAREKALKQFSYEVVAPQYMAVYEAALENGRS